MAAALIADRTLHQLVHAFPYLPPQSVAHLHLRDIALLSLAGGGGGGGGGGGEGGLLGHVCRGIRKGDEQFRKARRLGWRRQVWMVSHPTACGRRIDRI